MTKDRAISLLDLTSAGFHFGQPRLRGRMHLCEIETSEGSLSDDHPLDIDTGTDSCPDGSCDHGNISADLSDTDDDDERGSFLIIGGPRYE